MAMVGGFLFFLVDVRSVYMPLGMALKWVGFCFVVATVLTARYGKQYADETRQGCYTAALGIAMMIVIWASPWDPTAGPGTALVNMAIIFLVWRFATRVTLRLGREGETPEPRKRRLYGVDRLTFEAAKNQAASPLGQLKSKEDAAVLEAEKKARQGRSGDEAERADAHGNPSVGVARLAVGALVVIALAEPVLMAGAPQIGVRALAAVLVFLLGTALVLSAGSAIGALRTIRSQEGKVSETVVPWRLSVAFLAVALVLPLALAVPGVTYRGRGEIQQAMAPGEHTGMIRDESAEGSGSGEGDIDGAGGEEAGSQGQGESGENGKSAEHRGQDGGDGGQSSPPGDPAGAAGALLSNIAALGKLLWIPFLIALAVGGFVLLRRLGPLLWARRSRLAGWRAKLLELLARLSRTPAARREGRQGKVLRPIDYQALHRLEPGPAVAQSYVFVLDRLEALGHERAEDRTPYEYLNALPRHLVNWEASLRSLTELYVRVAYGGEKLTEADRKTALGLLRRVDAAVGE